MAALQGQVSIPQTALPAGSSLTVCRVKAPSNQRVKILGYGVFFDGISNSAQPVQIQIGRISADVASPAALTILPNEEELTETFQTSAVQSTSHANEPTYSSYLKTLAVHPQLGYEYLSPQGQEVVIKGGGMLGIVINAPATVNARGYVMFEE